MATVTSSSKLPILVSSGRSTPKLPHYSVLKLIRPLAADRDASNG
ncbi:hypothetical protein A2U01_0003916, partial [Trifolium medium]|nr:hypothetical protein [Trifolium medium]